MTATSSLMVDYLGHGTHAARPTTPNVGAGTTVIYYETDTTNTFAWTGSAWVQINGAGTGGPGADGWIVAEAWTYVSADGPTGVFSVASDVTAKYQPGMRVKYTQTTPKYGIITAVGAFGSGVTPITIYGGTDYALANAAISATYYTFVKVPFGFNASPAKWTETLSDVTNRAQASPVNGTWYNLGALSLSIPIGLWNVSYQVGLYMDRASANFMRAFVTLSTANNSESDVDFTAFLDADAAVDAGSTLHRTKLLSLASKTSYFINSKPGGTGLTNIINANDLSKLFVLAVCAYL